jgi:short subunit dehydrogenase-like uncharacterized protein
MAKDFDIVVYGASGFTGRLVAEYLGSIGHKSFAMAGRNGDKVKAVRDELGLDAEILTADGDDGDALRTLAERARTVITLAGPYQLYGDKLLAACIEAGTDYCDLCGEPAWMAEKIRESQDAAKASGARIVFSCGFDSIPSDLGMLHLQNRIKDEAGAPAERVKLFVREMKGTFSGGTAASLKATMKAAFTNPQVLEDLKNPFSLCPGFEGPRQPSGLKPHYDEEEETWLAPFIMAAINTKNVHRSNYLQGHAYGEGLVYDEMIPVGPGSDGERRAEAIAAEKSLGSDDGPKPGEGPSKEERDSGRYTLDLIARSGDGRFVTRVKGDRDPGYGSTSKMISETAIALNEDRPEGEGGIYTPAAVLGTALMERLHSRAGVTFETADDA